MRRGPKPSNSKPKSGAGFALFFLGILALGSGGIAYWLLHERGEVRVPLDEATLQSAIVGAFPVKGKERLYSYTLENPHLTLPEKGNRLRFSSDLAVRLPVGGPVKGIITVECGLRYDPATAALFAEHVKLTGLDIRKLPRGVTASLKPVITPLLDSTLKKQPLYTLTNATLPESLARATLKSVRVESGHIVAVFGVR